MSYVSDLLRRYFDALADSYFAGGGAYCRRGESIAVRVKRIMPGTASVIAGRFTVDAQTVCFRIPAAALKFAGAEITPEGGDAILYEGREYTVKAVILFFCFIFSAISFSFIRYSFKKNPVAE